MSRKLRVLHITHPDFLPPDTTDGYSEREINVWKTDYDVVTALRELGHDVRSLGVSDELVPVRDALVDYRPHIVFNLLEQFAGIPEFDQHVVSYFELHDVPYTGCNPRGLTLARDKSLAKKIVSYHRVPTPAFATFRRGRRVRRPARLELPAIVKSATEESSYGISQASVVWDDEALVASLETIGDSGVDGLIATNTTIARDAIAGMPHADEAGGLSGAPLLAPANRVLRIARDVLGAQFPILGSGGVMSADDALQKLAAGADLIQLYSGFIYHGPALVRDCARTIRQAAEDA